MKRVQISVIVPIYNVQDYLVPCLDSLSQQTSVFDEVILVNDGSTDGSRKICEEYCAKFENFILINQSNQGLSCARNKGMEIAQGDYVIFVDSDDYVNCNMGAILRSRLENDKLDALYFSADVQYEVNNTSTNNPYIREEQFCNKVMTGIDFFQASFPKQYIVSACLAVYKKSFLLDNGIIFPASLYYEDEVFCLESVLKAKGIACISDQLYIRRYRNNSIMTSGINAKKCKDIIEVILRNWELLHNQYKDKLNEQILRKFISNGIYQVIDKVGELEDKTTIQSELNSLESIFFKYWKELFVKEELSWADSGVVLFLLKNAKSGMTDLEEYNRLYDAVKSKFSRELIQKLRGLRLGDSCKNIGIFGIGNHTNKMIVLYQEFIGNIKANIYFIVTEKGKIKEFQKRKVVDCNEIPQNTDLIIVSSKVYQDEMNHHLMEVGVRNNVIHIIYDKDELCDFVLAWKVLKQ